MDAAKESRAQALGPGVQPPERRGEAHSPSSLKRESQPGLRPPRDRCAPRSTRARDAGSTSRRPIVLPTYSGKTEAMLALLACQRPERVLVVVPWTLLRDALGVGSRDVRGLLRGLGLLAAGAQNPIVGILGHRLETVESAQDFFARCNVVVATMACNHRVPSVGPRRDRRVP